MKQGTAPFGWRGWTAVATAAAIGVAAASAPAQADFRSSIKHLWGHIRKLADARYVQTTDADAKYFLKTDATALDQRYVLRTEVATRRGVYFAVWDASAIGASALATISYGTTLAEAPTAHVVLSGAAAPAECPGTPDAPEALPGHLCIYEKYAANRDVSTVLDPAKALAGMPGKYGVSISCKSVAVGTVLCMGSWAVTVP